MSTKSPDWEPEAGDIISDRGSRMYVVVRGSVERDGYYIFDYSYEYFRGPKDGPFTKEALVKDFKYVGKMPNLTGVFNAFKEKKSAAK